MHTKEPSKYSNIKLHSKTFPWTYNLAYFDSILVMKRERIKPWHNVTIT
jgi:hypothetical protein